MDSSDIVSLVIATVEDLREEREGAMCDPATESTVLFGQGGIFDSLGLVSLMVDVEQRVEDLSLSSTVIM